MKIRHFVCSCYSPEHTAIFTVDPGEDPEQLKEGDIPWPPEMYVDLQLNNYLPWYKRIIPAIRFLFGKTPKDTHWANWTLRNEDVDQLEKVLTEYKIYQEKWEKYTNQKIDKDSVIQVNKE